MTTPTAGAGGASRQEENRADAMRSTPRATWAAPSEAHGGRYLSADGRWWWDGARWQPLTRGVPQDTDQARHVAAQPPPAAAPFRVQDGRYVTPDGSSWWDGSCWRPVPRTKRQRRTTAAAVLVAVSVLWWGVAAYGAAMSSIGIADQAHALDPGWADVLFWQLLFLPGVIPGVVALALRPPETALKVAAWVAVVGNLLVDCLFLGVLFSVGS